MRALSWAVVVATLALTGACSATPAARQAAAPAPSVTLTAAGDLISPATLTVGQPIAAPSGKPVLTMTGRISAQNRDGALAFDLPTLRQLGVSKVRLYEPWTKQDLDFRGIWLQDLVTVAGVKAEATKLHNVALDHYAVELSLADIRAGGIMLALSAGDGSAIPIDKGGPTRVVFLKGVPAGVNPDQWVWSIKTIDVM